MVTLSFTPFYLGSSGFNPFIINTLQNLSVKGLCLRINDSGVFAWINLTALSQTHFIACYESLEIKMFEIISSMVLYVVKY